jgi:hypothetical protein
MSAAAAKRQSTKSTPVSKVFDFESKLFQIEGAFFALAPDTRAPSYHVKLGSLEAALALRTLPNSFDLTEKDRKLLDVVGSSLRFLREIRPGDSIPSELLNGTASWSVEERHRTLAQNRMTVAIAFWASDRKADMPSADQCKDLVKDEQTMAAYQQGCEKLAQGLGSGGPEAAANVAKRVEAVTRELAYIEALRERYRRVFRIAGIVNRLANHFRADPVVVETITRVRALMQRPVERFRATFIEIDDSLDNPVKLFKRVDATVQSIRDHRDDLHVNLINWEHLAERCDNTVVERSAACEALLKDIHALLVTEYPAEQSWR